MPPKVPYDPTANPYPKVMYHKEYPANTKIDHAGTPHVIVKGERIDVPEEFKPRSVKNEDEEAALGPEWSDTPGPAPAVAKTEKKDAAAKTEKK